MPLMLRCSHMVFCRLLTVTFNDSERFQELVSHLCFVLSQNEVTLTENPLNEG